MSFVGRLEDLALAEILHMLAVSGKTGKLVLTRRDGEGLLVFKDGKIIYAASNSAREAFGKGFMPGGSTANKKFCQSAVAVPEESDPALIDLVFDAQTSGGLVLSVPVDKMKQAREMLLEAGDLAVHIGQVMAADPSGVKLRII